VTNVLALTAKPARVHIIGSQPLAPGGTINTVSGTQISLAASKSYPDAHPCCYSAAGPLYKRTDDTAKLNSICVLNGIK